MTERRYGQWAGNEKGCPEKKECCIEEIPLYKGSFLYKQCERKRGHGLNGEYCKVHARRYPAKP